LILCAISGFFTRAGSLDFRAPFVLPTPVVFDVAAAVGRVCSPGEGLLATVFLDATPAFDEVVLFNSTGLDVLDLFDAFARATLGVPALVAFLFSARTNWSFRISRHPEIPCRLAICSRSLRVRSFKLTGVINGLYLRTWDVRRAARGSCLCRALRDEIRRLPNPLGSP
jgi:hypothetical protein